MLCLSMFVSDFKNARQRFGQQKFCLFVKIMQFDDARQTEYFAFDQSHKLFQNIQKFVDKKFRFGELVLSLKLTCY